MRYEYPDFLSKYLGEPVAPIPDCNNCKWLNITEVEQEHVKRRSTVNEHACLLYGRRVFHRASTRRRNSFIFPCEECINDDYKYMKGEE